VFKEALARPGTANPFLTWNLFTVQGRNWRADAALLAPERGEELSRSRANA
jgi:hypothetical protein